MKRILEYRRVWTAAALLGLLLVVLLAAASARAQDSVIAELKNRLEEKGLPVEGVKVVSRLPLIIEIEMASASETDLLTVEDLYNRLIAQREASLYHRIGSRIDRFSIIMRNQKGEEVSHFTQELAPDQFTQSEAVRSTTLSEQQVREILAERFPMRELSGVEIREFSLQPANTPGGQGYELFIQLASDDLSAANSDFLRLYGAFNQLTLEQENPAYFNAPELGIVIFHLQILNKDGQVALNVLKDLELHLESERTTTTDLHWLINRGGPSVQIVPTATAAAPPESYPQP